jgi:hypothetical protein
MKKTLIVLSLTALLFPACRKNRVCECTNSNGTYDAGEIDATRSQGKKFCKGLSEGQTTCKLK